MSELVERLRDRNAIVLSGLFHAIPAMREAANEIERLSKQLDAEHENSVLLERERDNAMKQLVCFQWQPIATAPTDGSEILILTTIGATQARFATGEWVEHHEGREYNGPAWVCCDDQWNIEIEDCGKDGMHHGMATHWMPLLPFTDDHGATK